MRRNIKWRNISTPLRLQYEYFSTSLSFPIRFQRISFRASRGKEAQSVRLEEEATLEERDEACAEETMVAGRAR